MTYIVYFLKHNKQILNTNTLFYIVFILAMKHGKDYAKDCDIPCFKSYDCDVHCLLLYDCDISAVFSYMTVIYPLS